MLTIGTLRVVYLAIPGSSLQFHAAGAVAADVPAFVAACKARGVVLKWFGADEPAGFTSRFDSWRYLYNNDGDGGGSGEGCKEGGGGGGAAATAAGAGAGVPALPRTRAVLATTLDLRIPLTFSCEDCSVIAAIIVDEAAKAVKEAAALDDEAPLTLQNRIEVQDRVEEEAWLLSP